MNYKKYIVVFVILILILVSSLAYGIYIPKDSEFSEEFVFMILKGERVTDISVRMEEEGIIRSAFLFNLQAIISGNYKNLQAGSYMVSPSMSTVDIINKIHRGETVQIRLTFIEGWISDQIADYLDGFDGFDGKKFIDLVDSYSKIDQRILRDRPEGVNLEGYLFPDTYLFSYGMSEKEIIEAMISNLERKISEEEWSEMAKSGNSFFEILTMASIIEKEVRSYEEKRIVSGILWKRMEIGMPLQVDATIIYLTGKRTTRVSIEETRIDSPYNTYLNRGLPPGPISNPGIESIMAAIYPLPSDYLFYLSKPDGETVFSRNLEEHNIAKNKYLR